MDVVEVKDFQCHSDGEEVVILDLDKVNNVDTQEVEEVPSNNINGENSVVNTNGVEIVEIINKLQENNQCSGIVDTSTSAITVDLSDVAQNDSANNVAVGENNICEVPYDAPCTNTTLNENGHMDELSNIDKSNILENQENIKNDSIKIECKTDKIDETNNIEDEIVNAEDKTINIEDKTKNLEDKIINIEDKTKTVEDKTINIEDKTKNVEDQTKTQDNKPKISITIPPHIAGRDVSSLTEEKLPRSGKRMLKPRFGVKVPYIHMTSQIVTQDEIAKELFERFQQKYPMTRVEKPDKLFSMKLTHRLANKISPLKSPDGKLKEPLKKNNSDLKNVKDSIEQTLISSKPNNSMNTKGNDQTILNNDSCDDLLVASCNINSTQQIDQITNTLKNLEQSEESNPNISDDKNDGKISSNEELIAILEDFETIESADTNGNKVSDSKQLVKCPIKRKILRNNSRSKRSKPKLDPEIEKQIALKQLEEVSRPKRFDSHFVKKKVDNDKKIIAKNDTNSVQKRKKPSSGDVPEVKIAIDHYIKSYTDKRQSNIKAELAENEETETEIENSDDVEVENSTTPTNNVTKARTMREINRLLGDEGAINMIYSLEKRRTPGNNNLKNVLPSTRRKKKDLMLKTKLVKNAMLKMSSPNNSSISSNRLIRRSDVTPTISPEEKMSRKMSVDSQGSDQSTHFSGRKAIPADESKIIRKHSSSSEASSIGISPLFPVPEAIPIPNITSKHIPVKALRVYTRKNKNSDDSFIIDDITSLNELNSKPNKCTTRSKNSNQKAKKDSLQTAAKLSTECIKQDVDDTTYNELTIRHYDGVVHITLTPVSTTMKNALNISVMEELINELNILENDDSCKVVLISSAGRIFCQGLDIAPLINDDPQICHDIAVKMASTIKKFITCLGDFPKLLVAGVDGAAVGLGATMLVHFDLVFASDKATFETPYAQLGHIAEGAATTILGRLLVAEMIMGSQRLTAGQAHYYGLVTRTLWPDRFHDELIPLVKALARQSLQAMKTSKALQKQETKDKLSKALDTETQILIQQWIGEECQLSLQRYLKDAVDNLNT
ncbi:uncharacterized protein LOC126905261 isoform X2 [Daktulosphaira vitifoliae]|uniref:uncharacterized protein LOC126905261 isoform X2 n=1 Tax=Daktulosphaira vitifoliae TaxID=58002 RepID=UPI0021AAD7EB|nr:uncharacterized protein LOC126905261 isoform X2 [Daktulosphaira vitifoliae]